jgi:hypothetical protein
MILRRICLNIVGDKVVGSHEMTDASKDAVIVAKNKRIKELEEEDKRLKDILKRRYGEDYDKGI